jgi:hypothetical protein
MKRQLECSKNSSCVSVTGGVLIRILERLVVTIICLYVEYYIRLIELLALLTKLTGVEILYCRNSLFISTAPSSLHTH